MELAKICRVCLLQEDRVLLLDWHQRIDSLEYDLSYMECFCRCTQINLSLKDDPTDTEDTRAQYLCFCCAQSLKDAHEFIEKAKKADHELRSLQINKHFEWVTVSAKDVVTVLKEDTVADDKNCLDETNEIYTMNNEKADENEFNTANDIDEDITIANLKKELAEHSLAEKTKHTAKIKHKRKQILDEGVKSENECGDEGFMAEAGTIFSEESGQGMLSDNEFKKRSPKKKGMSKVNSEKPRKPRMKLNQEEMVTCEVCKKTLKRKALKKHRRCHRPKTFLCKACPRTFNSANTLKNHERTHDENRKKFPCEKCDQSFVSIYSYRAHQQTHEVNRKPTFKCTLCDKAFLQRSGLNNHRLLHEGPKWICNLCDKRYTRQSELKIHMRTHSGETPFQCNICGKSFIHKGFLNQHMQRHGGFFRFPCRICGEQFESYSKYYTHRQQHLGLPYKCGVCERPFNDAYKCKRHVRGVHKIAEDSEVEKLALRMYDAREHRGRIVEVIKNPDEQEIL